MNEDKDADKISSLKALVDQYQDTQAPPGFAERVAANARDTETGHRKLLPLRIFSSPSGKDATNAFGWAASAWVIAASFAVVMVSAVLVLNVKDHSGDDLQLANQKKSSSENTLAQNNRVQNATPPVKDSPVQSGLGNSSVAEQGTAKQDTAVAKVTEPPVPAQKQQSTPIAKVVDKQTINPKWDQPVDDSDFTSVAVLWEASDWLTEEAVVSPDFSEMPALSEIDALFDKT